MYYDLDIKAFYKYLKVEEFDNLEKTRVEYLRDLGYSIFVEKINNKYIDLPFFKKYTKLMNNLKMTPYLFGLTSNAEMYLLFMFSVDPNFNCLLISSEVNKIKELRSKMEKEFGVFDLNLIRIENVYLKKIMDKKEKEIIEEEIDRRSFK